MNMSHSSNMKEYGDGNEGEVDRACSRHGGDEKLT
jgi:hypothetical protein